MTSLLFNVLLFHQLPNAAQITASPLDRAALSPSHSGGVSRARKGSARRDIRGARLVTQRASTSGNEAHNLSTITREQQYSDRELLESIWRKIDGLAAIVVGPAGSAPTWIPTTEEDTDDDGEEIDLEPHAHHPTSTEAS
jgi:hypothetical protein